MEAEYVLLGASDPMSAVPLRPTVVAPYRTPDAPPQRRLPLLEQRTIRTPCRVAWRTMDGDERRRFCFTCSKSVYDLSAMTEDEAESFLAVHLDDDEGARVRLYRRPDGRVLTSDCPVGAKRRHRARAALAVTGGALAVVGGASLVANVRVPHAHHSAHARQACFEPPRAIPNDPIRAGASPVPDPFVFYELASARQAWGHTEEPDPSDLPDTNPHRPRPPPALVQGEVTVTPGLSSLVVERIVRRSFPRFEACYEVGRFTDRALAGKLATSFTVARDGSVSTVTPESAASSLHDHDVVACVANAFAALSFPAPVLEPANDVVRVRYVIAFRPTF